jgi:hypothetical protein
MLKPEPEPEPASLNAGGKEFTCVALINLINSYNSQKAESRPVSRAGGEREPETRRAQAGRLRC